MKSPNPILNAQEYKKITPVKKNKSSVFNQPAVRSEKAPSAPVADKTESAPIVRAQKRFNMPTNPIASASQYKDINPIKKSTASVFNQAEERFRPSNNPIRSATEYTPSIGIRRLNNDIPLMISKDRRIYDAENNIYQKAISEQKRFEAAGRFDIANRYKQNALESYQRIKKIKDRTVGTSFEGIYDQRNFEDIDKDISSVKEKLAIAEGRLMPYGSAKAYNDPEYKKLYVDVAVTKTQLKTLEAEREKKQQLENNYNSYMTEERAKAYTQQELNNEIVKATGDMYTSNTEARKEAQSRLKDLNGILSARIEYDKKLARQNAMQIYKTKPEQYINAGKNSKYNPLNKKIAHEYEAALQAEAQHNPEVKNYINFAYGYFDKKTAKKMVDEYIFDFSLQKNSELSEKSGAWKNIANPITNIISTVGTPIYSGEMLLNQAKDKLSGVETQLDDYSPGSKTMRLNKKSAEEFVKGDSAGMAFFKNALLSAANNAVNVMIGGEAGTLAMMGAQAGSKSAYDAKLKGASDDKALLNGAIQGSIEVLTEKLPFESLMQGYKGAKSLTKGQLMGYILKQIPKQAITEYGEETVNQYLSTVADIALMGDKSDYKQYISDLMHSGIDQETAISTANKKFFLTDPQMAGLSGALSGALMSGGSIAVGAVNGRGNNKIYYNAGGMLISEDGKTVKNVSGENQDNNQYAIKTSPKTEPNVANYTQNSKAVTENALKTKRHGKIGYMLKGIMSGENITFKNMKSELQKINPNVSDVDVRKAVNSFLDEKAKVSGATQIVLKSAARLANVNIVISDIESDTGVNGAEGYFDGNTVVIDYETAQDSFKVADKVLKHELTHSAESSEHYNDLKQFALDTMFKGDKTMQDKAINGIMSKYTNSGVKLNIADAEHELVADFVSKQLLKNENIITDLADRRPGTARGILNSLKEVFTRSKSYIKNETLFSRRFNTLTDLEKTIKLFEKAINTRKAFNIEESITKFSLGGSNDKDKSATRAIYSDLMTKKGLNAVNRDKNVFVKSLNEILGASNLSNNNNRALIKGTLQNIATKYFETEKINRNDFDKLFDTVYGNAVITSDEEYKNYSDLRKKLRETKMFLPNAYKGDIADYNELKKRYFGRIKLVSENADGAVSVDAIYDELSMEYPEKFPSDIINVADRLSIIAEVCDSLKKTEQKLDEYHGAEAGVFKDSAKYEYDKIVDKFIDNLKNTKRYEENSIPDGVIPSSRNMTAKSEKLLSTNEITFLRNIGHEFGLDPTELSGRTELKQYVDTIAKKYMETGEVDASDVSDMVTACIVTTREIYEDIHNRYSELMNILNGQEVQPTELRAFHRDLAEKYPEFFTPGLLRIDDIKKEIKNASIKLNGYEERYIKYKNDDEVNKILPTISNITEKFIETLDHVMKYEESSKKKGEKASEGSDYTFEQISKVYDEIREENRKISKEIKYNLLTKSDKLQVERLLSGEISESDVNGPNRNTILRDFKSKQKINNLNTIIINYKNAVRLKYLEDAKADVAHSLQWKDKKTGLQFSRETPFRNFLDVTGDEALAYKYADTPERNEADRNSFMESFRSRVKKMKLSTDESIAVQFLGEVDFDIKKYESIPVKRRNSKQQRELDELKAQKNDFITNNQKLDYSKIEKAIVEFQKIYNELYRMINKVRIDNGYSPIGKIEGYFPHFFKDDENNFFAKIGKVMGINTDVSILPTDIAGKTHTFKPGITWFGNAKKREGIHTDYDAVFAFDKYIQGASDIIFHTQDIQRLRALERAVREQYADDSIKKKVKEIRENNTITEEQKDIIISELLEKGNTHLNNFVQFVAGYANQIANKKSFSDRNMERLIGRKAYNCSRWLEARVAANMISGNIASACTNFIPIQQMKGFVGESNIIRGTASTLKAMVVHDDIYEHSTFLRNRRGTNLLSKKTFEKIADTLSIPMTIIDEFASNVVVRSRYSQNIRSGMTHSEALREADRFAANLMVARTKTAIPDIFNAKNPINKLFTQFQIEVNNQYSAVFKDLPREKKEKGIAALAIGLFKIFVSSYIFNDIYEKIYGRRSATDPIGIGNDLVGQLTGKKLNNSVDIIFSMLKGTGIEKSVFKNVKKQKAVSALGNGLDDTLKELPFIGGILGGGRIPISSALPDVGSILSATLDSDASKLYKKKVLKNELSKLGYIISPFGYGQAQKSFKGISTVRNGGSYSYNKKGEKILQYPVYNDSRKETSSNYAKALIGGKTALNGNKNWADNGFNSLNEKDTGRYLKLKENGNISSKTAYEAVAGIADKKIQQKPRKIHEYLSGLKVNDAGKALIEYEYLDEKNQRKANDLKSSGDMSLSKALNMVYKFGVDSKSTEESSKDYNKRVADYYRSLLPEGQKKYIDLTTYAENKSDYQRFALLYDSSFTPKQKAAYDKYYINELKKPRDYTSENDYFISMMTESQQKKAEKNGYFSSRDNELVSVLGQERYDRWIKVASEGNTEAEKKKILQDKGLSEAQAQYFYDNAIKRNATVSGIASVMKAKTYFYFLKEANRGSNRNEKLKILCEKGMTQEQALYFYENVLK